MIKNYHNDFEFKYSVYTSVFLHVIFFLIILIVFAPKKEKVYIDIPIELLQLSSPIIEEIKEPEKIQQQEESVEKKEIKKEAKVEIKKEVSVEQIKKELPKKEEKILSQEEFKEEPKEKQKTRLRTRSRAAVSNNVQSTLTPKLEIENFPYPYYLRIIQAKVSKKWEAPSEVVGFLHTIVYFRIDRNGNVLMYNVYKESGNKVFDHAALRAVAISGPYPDLPKDYAESYLGVYFGFQYKS